MPLLLLTEAMSSIRCLPPAPRLRTRPLPRRLADIAVAGNPIAIYSHEIGAKLHNTQALHDWYKDEPILPYPTPVSARKLSRTATPQLNST